MRISDWSSDVCSSDLSAGSGHVSSEGTPGHLWPLSRLYRLRHGAALLRRYYRAANSGHGRTLRYGEARKGQSGKLACHRGSDAACLCRSEEHTSELQSLMRISYAVFCLKKKKKN